MSRIVAAIAISLIAGFAVGAWITGDESTSAINDAESSARTEERLLSLEQLIAEEREARLDLEDQLWLLIEKIGRIDSDEPRAVSGEVTRVAEAQAVRQLDRRAPRATRPRRSRRRGPCPRAARRSCETSRIEG